MLLTLTASCLRPLLVPGPEGRPELSLLDLPDFARHTLGLHGLYISTDLLAGADRSKLEHLRENADKAGCACLLLVEPEPQPFGDPSDDKGEAAIERIRRVVQAAHILGCSAVAVRCAGPDDPDVFDMTAERLKDAVGRAERLELNVLLSPTPGLTQSPDRVTEMIKRVGGFRVGTFPDFEAAAAVPDPAGYLRRLTPYASAVTASTSEFTEPKAEKPKRKPRKAPAAQAPEESEPGEQTPPPEPEEPPLEHRPYELEPLVRAVKSVGYDGTLGLDYRGGGDPKLGVLRSRRAIEAILKAENGAP